MTQKTTLVSWAVLLVSSAVSTSAFAQDMTSAVSEETINRGYSGDEMFGIKPAVGLNTYNDSIGGRSTRASYGFQSEFNLANAVGLNFNRWFVGPQTGFMFSHLGNGDSNFFGANPGVDTGEGGANMFLIPADLKVGFAPIKWFRFGVHGGGNLIYRSIASSIGLGNAGLNWLFVPNVGADFDFSLSKSVAVSIRPDWTLSATESMFSASAALGIALG